MKVNWIIKVWRIVLCLSVCLSLSLSLSLRMLGRAFLRTALLLWLAQLTLQGGTGYKPQNGGLGQMSMPSKGYGLGAQNANAYQPNIKAQGYGPAANQLNGNGAKGYGPAANQLNGNGAKGYGPAANQPYGSGAKGPYKGYGVSPAAQGNGNGAKPNGPYKGYSASPAALGNGNGAKPNGPYKGYGTAPAFPGNGNGAKPNGYGNNGKPNGFGALQGAVKGNEGYGSGPMASKSQGPKPNAYGASPFSANSQQARPNPNGGFGSKPNKPGYGAQPANGGFGAGRSMAPPMANKGRGGYSKGNGFGYADSSFTGYRNRPAASNQAGYGGGYPNGAKAAKPGFGGRPLTQNGQAAKPNGYGPSAGGSNAQGEKPAGYGGTKGPKAGYGGYPNGGAFKGPKPGYGGLPTGYGQRPNGYGGYPNGGAKAPKPGYGIGIGNGGASNRQGAKPNGYGVPAGVPNVKPGYGPAPGSRYPNSGGAKASKSGPGYGPKTNQQGYVNPGAGYGYGNGGAGQLPYNGAPIMSARLDGTNPIEPQTAELGPEVKSGRAYAGPFGAQPAGFGSEGQPQTRYGIGGLHFGGSNMGYNPYGNPNAAQLYGSQAAGNYNPLDFNANPKSAAKHMMGGSPYAASSSDPTASGKYGPYGGQQLGFGNSGNNGQTGGPYTPESISLGAGAKSSEKYGNPSLPYEALGPVTDGQFVDQPASQYEAPAIDGVKSIDQFGDGEVQPQPITYLVDGVGQGPASYTKGGVRAEAVSLPATPTDSPFSGSATSFGNPAYSQVDMPTEIETPQNVLAQQNLKGPQMPQSWTGGKEPKHNLKGFYGNRYHG